jgi:hypothetical protein
MIIAVGLLAGVNHDKFFHDEEKKEAGNNAHT